MLIQNQTAFGRIYGPNYQRNPSDVGSPTHSLAGGTLPLRVPASPSPPPKPPAPSHPGGATRQAAPLALQLARAFGIRAAPSLPRPLPLWCLKQERERLKSCSSNSSAPPAPLAADSIQAELNPHCISFPTTPGSASKKLPPRRRCPTLLRTRGCARNTSWFAKKRCRTAAWHQTSHITQLQGGFCHGETSAPYARVEEATGLRKAISPPSNFAF